MILNRGADPIKPVSLAEVAASGSYLVENISGPEPQRLRLRLRLNEMGIIAGARLSVIASSNQGMLVIKVGGSRMALSRGNTEHIWVRGSAT